MNLRRNKKIIKRDKQKTKKLTLSVLRKRLVNIMRKNNLKFTRKEKKDKQGETSNVIKKNNENVTRKKNGQRHKQ